MSKTDLIRKLINNTGLNMKAFSKKANIPYTTLRSILDRGIENASVNNVLKLCTALEISIENLYDTSIKNTFDSKDKTTLFNNYNHLNNLGKNKLLEYSYDLIENPKYSSSNLVSEFIDAVNDDNLTEEEKKNIEKILKKALKEIKNRSEKPLR